MAGLATLAQTAPAQTVQDLAAAQAQAIQRDASQAPQTRAGSAPTPPIPGRDAPSALCLDIGDISVDGVALLRLRTVDAVIAPFKGQCLGLSGINAVLEAVTFAYVDKGYVAARAYLPKQDLSDGELEIVVVEGRLETIVMNGDPSALPGQKATAFPGMTGRALNLRDIEQGLDQMGRLRSVDAQMQIAAGSEQGASVLEVTRRADRPWHGSVGINNNGSAATGENILSFDVGFDDALGHNDSLSFGYQRSMTRFPLTPSGERPNGDTLTLGFEIPYGYWTFGLSGMRNFYRSQITGALGVIETSGSSTNLSATADWLVFRNQTAKTTLSAGLTWKDTQSFVLGSLVDVSSRSLSVLNVSLSDSRQLFGGQATASFGVQQGLPIWGAFDDATAPSGAPLGQFRKYDVSLGFSRDWSVGAHGLSYWGALTGQWSRDLLFGSEQMSIGGRSSVRGSESGVLFGNRAAYLRNEFTWKLPALTDPPWAPALGRLEAYSALDIGRVWHEAEHGITGGLLSGGAIGLRMTEGRVRADISYADLIKGPDHVRATLDKAGVVSASLTVDF